MGPYFQAVSRYIGLKTGFIYGRYLQVLLVPVAWQLVKGFSSHTAHLDASIPAIILWKNVTLVGDVAPKLKRSIHSYMWLYQIISFIISYVTTQMNIQDILCIIM